MGMDNMREEKDSKKPNPLIAQQQKSLKVFGALSLITLPMQFYYDLPGDLEQKTDKISYL